MVECGYCGEEFESDRELHLHWGEEHEDEINSHERDKVKKARRKKEEEKEAQTRRRRKMAGWGLAGVLALAFVIFVGSQMISMTSGEAELDLEGQPMMGEEDAPVTVASFGDYRCPYCKQFETISKPQLVENYVNEGQVKYYHIDLPLASHEPGATNAAVAAQCVYQQDEEQFWNYHNALYENQDEFSYNNQGLMTLAEESTEGLDMEQLESCIEDRETIEAVNSDKQMARENAVTSTPTVFVNGQQVNWDYSQLRSQIEQELP